MVARNRHSDPAGKRGRVGAAVDAVKSFVGGKAGALEMWPKVLMQLFELLPHVSKLVPVAERYFAAKQIGDGPVPDAAFVSIAEDMRGDLNQVTKAHASLYRQMQDQGNQIAELSEELRRTRALTEQSDRRIVTVDGKLDSLEIWIKAGVVLAVILIALVLVLLVRGH